MIHGSRNTMNTHTTQESIPGIRQRLEGKRNYDELLTSYEKTKRCNFVTHLFLAAPIGSASRGK